MKKVYCNGEVVNEFETEYEAYSFAIAIRDNETDIDYDGKVDEIGFEDEDGHICLI